MRRRLTTAARTVYRSSCRPPRNTLSIRTFAKTGWIRPRPVLNTLRATDTSSTFRCGRTYWLKYRIVARSVSSMDYAFYLLGSLPCPAPLLDPCVREDDSSTIDLASKETLLSFPIWRPLHRFLCSQE